MRKIIIRKDELQRILKIMNENSLEQVNVIYDSSTGIGSTLDIEFDHLLHGETPATVRVKITDTENW